MPLFVYEEDEGDRGWGMEGGGGWKGAGGNIMGKCMFDQYGITIFFFLQQHPFIHTQKQ